MPQELSIWSHLALGMDLQSVAEYLSAGGDANAVNEQRSLLFFAASGGAPGAVRMLLDHGADAGWVDPFTGITALHVVVRRRDLDAAEALLDAAAAVDAVDKHGNTPLMISVDSHPPIDVDVVRLLIERGASADVANQFGVTARQIAAGNAELEAALDATSDDAER